LQRLDEAIVSLERATRLAPTRVPAREELADAYAARGRAADELSQLEGLSQVEDTPARSARVALAQARLGQEAAALARLEAAAEQAPGNAHVQLALARVYLSRAERGTRTAASRAAAVLERALGGTVRRSEGLALFGRALSLSGDDVEAERILREAVATSPVDPEAFAFLADAAERLSHFAQARDALMTLDILQGDTASSETRAFRAERLAGLALRANDASSALAFVAQALDRGRSARRLALLAQARLQVADRDGARQAVDEGLAVDPRDQELLRMRRQLAR
jgi:predicted Zn-dependent protease